MAPEAGTAPRLKLLLDEMLDPAIAERLSRRGHEVEAVAERPDLRTQPDSVILAAAEDEDRVIVTQDLGDFRVLAASRGALRPPSPRAHPDKRTELASRQPAHARPPRERRSMICSTSGVAIEGERWLAPPD